MNKSTTFILALILAFCNIAKSKASHSFIDDWKAETVISEADVKNAGIDNCFKSEKISDDIFKRMWLKSWKKNCTMKRDDLRYLKILHRNADGKPQLGEMVVNKAISDKVLRIFRKLYDAGYRIERMVLVDNYDADDETSMRANNTSCFNFRFITLSKTKISKHGKGLAIDINTLYNPYVRQTSNGTYHIEPSTAKNYAFNRDKRNDIPYKIDRNDLAYKLFIAEGFEWGGSWDNRKDYQHFEIDL